MLFNSGNPSLLGLVRLYAADPSTSAQPKWTDQQIKDEINNVYAELLDHWRQMGEGQLQKVSYDDAVASTVTYAKPTGMVRLLYAAISNNGSDLSTVAPSSSQVIHLTPSSAEVARSAYDTQALTSIKYIFIEGSNYGILAPPGADQAGTNTIKLLYEATGTELSGDTDEPIIPRSHQALISIGAALRLKVSRNLPAGDLASLWSSGLVNYRRSLHDTLFDPEGSIPVERQDLGLDRGVRFGSVVKKG